GAAPRTHKRVAHLRDASAAGRAHGSAEIHLFSVGVGVGEVRDSLAAKEPAQRAVGESEARKQAVAPVLLQGLAAELGATGEVPLEKRPCVAPGGRGARLDVEPRLLWAPTEDPVAARMVGRTRHIAVAGDDPTV